MSEAPEGLHVDERRLAAILAADVAGYSRLMGRNEEETVRDLEAHQAVILPLIAKHGGAVINIAGDGVVAQFPSAVRAVECAVAIQKIMAERNFDIPAERRMLLRIGVNLGDIIHDGTRTYGDGINVAARLEPIAEPGGICISATVREAIFGKLGLPLRDLGEKALKNIDRPVHIYQIQAAGTRSRRDWLGVGLRQYRRLAPALGLVVLLAALAGVGAWRFWPRSALESDGMPTVAVLPFTTQGNDPEQIDFARSLTREVSAYLSTFPGAHTLAIPESAAKLSPREQAQQSGATYLARGRRGQGWWKDPCRCPPDRRRNGGEPVVRSLRLRGLGSARSPESKPHARSTAPSAAVMAWSSRPKQRSPGASRTASSPTTTITPGPGPLRSGHPRRLCPGAANCRGGLSAFPNSPALNLLMAHAYVMDELDLGPFADCHEMFALAWKYASQADKAKSKSRWLAYQHHSLMARLYAMHAGDFERSVGEAKAAIEMAPNEAYQRSA